MGSCAVVDAVVDVNHPSCRSDVVDVASSGPVCTPSASDNEAMPPLVEAGTDLRCYESMPIDIERLFNSRFNAITDDTEWRAGVTLWLKSYHQVPAASLPDDDVELCRLAGLGRDMETWARIKWKALYGWVKCTDGRWYHPVVAEKANTAWARKIRFSKRGRRANEVRWKHRAVDGAGKPTNPRGEAAGARGEEARCASRESAQTLAWRSDLRRQGGVLLQRDGSSHDERAIQGGVRQDQGASGAGAGGATGQPQSVTVSLQAILQERERILQAEYCEDVALCHAADDEKESCAAPDPVVSHAQEACATQPKAEPEERVLCQADATDTVRQEDGQDVCGTVEETVVASSDEDQSVQSVQSADLFGDLPSVEAKPSKPESPPSGKREGLGPRVREIFREAKKVKRQLEAEGGAVESARTSADKARGTRLPEDWTLPDSWRDWALREKPGWTLERVHAVAEYFRDYWISKAGPDARKVNWEATWRNWVRTQREGMRGRTASGGQRELSVAEHNRWAFEEAKRLIFGNNPPPQKKTSPTDEKRDLFGVSHAI